LAIYTNTSLLFLKQSTLLIIAPYPGIVQDDKDDWERESARMASIYSQSYLSIAATRATNCDEGVLGPRARPTSTLISFEDDQGPYELYFEQRPRGLGTAEEFIQNVEMPI
jgi:hypothetical protein